jgi:hypothetical protein
LNFVVADCVAYVSAVYAASIFRVLKMETVCTSETSATLLISTGYTGRSKNRININTELLYTFCIIHITGLSPETNRSTHGLSPPHTHTHTGYIIIFNLMQIKNSRYLKC